MADLNPLELRNYAFAQGTVINQDDLLLDDDLTVPSETRQCAVGDLTVQYYRAGEPGGRNTEEVVTVLQGNERVYEAVYDSFDESGEPTDFSVGLSDLSPAQLESLQQVIALQQAEPQIKGFATMQDSYVEDYGPDAALVATVFALGERGELFDQWLDDNGKTVNSSFYRVPNSTLVVNQVGTFGEDESYFVLDVDEPLLEVVRFGYAGIKLNNLSLSQVETLKTAQREGANPLLIGEAHFETGMGQFLTNDGQAQARAILSQGDSITPAMVAELNELMAIEEDIRRQDQVERGLGGDVSYPRYTVEELNRELSLDTIARQLSAQSPVIDVQAQVVAEAQSQQPVMQSVSDYMETVTPENIGSMVYAQYYRWADKNWGRSEPEAEFVRAGFLVESLGNAIGSHDPMPFQVIDIATDRVVMDFTLAEGVWVERPQTAAEIEAGERPASDFTGDTVVVNRLDESVKTLLLLGFEAPHRKANLIASTHLNESLKDEVYLESGLIFQREYDEDGSLWRDLTFSRDAVLSNGNLYALSQAFPDGGGMGTRIPLAIEWVISQEFEHLVDEYEATRQATVQALQQPQALQSSQEALSDEATGQRPPKVSRPKSRSQTVVQEPSGTGYKSGYESKSTNPLVNEANVMVAVQEPVQAQTQIDIRDLMSVKTLAIVDEGKVPRQRVEVDGKTQQVDRTPAEGLTMVARAAYGAENFCQENNLPHTPATDVIAAAAVQLKLEGPQVSAVLDGIKKEECRPGIEVATRSQVGVWARIEEKYPEYGNRVPDVIKVERAMAQPAADVKTAVEAATKREVPRPVLRQKESAVPTQGQPSQAEMAVTVAAYRLKTAGVDRWGQDNEKATLIFNRSKEGNISVINKDDNTVIATRNGVTGAVQGNVPEAMDFSAAYKAVVAQQVELYASKSAGSRAKAGAER